MTEGSPDPSTSRRRLLGAAGGALAGVPALAWARGRTNGRAPADAAPLDQEETETPTPTPEPPDVLWPLFQFDRRNTGHDPDGEGPASAVGARWGHLDGAEYRTTPVVRRDAVFAADEGIPGEVGSSVRAVDVADGTERWRTPVETTDPRMTAQGDTVFVPSTESTSSLVALDARDGSRRWDVPLGESPGGGPVGVVADGTTAYVASYDGVFRVDTEEAEVVWHYDGVILEDTSVAVVDDAVYAAGTFYGRVARIEPSGGETNWVTEFETVTGTPTVAGDRIVVPSGEALVSLDDFTGNEQWRYDATVGSSVAVADGVVYGTTTGGEAFALNPDDGSERWRVGAVRGSLPPLVVGDSLYLAGTDGTLAALDPADGSTLWSTAIGAGLAANPAVVGGELYVADRAGRIGALAPGAAGGFDTATPTRTPTPTRASTPTPTASPTPSPSSPSSPSSPARTPTGFDDPDVGTPTPAPTTAPPGTGTPEPSGGGLDLPLLGGGVAALAALAGGALWWRNRGDDEYDPLG